MSRLTVFISSTADLKGERDAVEMALAELEIDGNRFESWPTAPITPLDECLRRISGSHAYVLILGSSYGRIVDSGKSSTHLEYLEAIRLNKPVFAFVLACTDRESKQRNFLEEIDRVHFRGSQVRDASELKDAVRKSLLAEFARCFRSVHDDSNRIPPPTETKRTHREKIIVPVEAAAALAMLRQLYHKYDDETIHEFAPECEQRFGDYPEILNIIFLNEVNRGMREKSYEPSRIAAAIDLWNLGKECSKGARPALDYNIANALSVLKRYPAAIESYKRSLSVQPNYPECWKNLGTALFYVGETDKAMSCFEKALEINPDLVEALYSLATTYYTHFHDPQKALAYWDRLLSKCKDEYISAGAYAWRALVLLSLRKPGEAVESADRAILLAGNAPWAWKIAARLYVLLRHENIGWLERAAMFWKKYTEKYPSEAEAWIEYGHVAWDLCMVKLDQTWRPRSIDYYKRGLRLGYVDDGFVCARIDQ